MIRTTEKGIERLPLHRAIIVRIETCLTGMENLNNRKPTVNPSKDVGSLHQEHRNLLLHQIEVAKTEGELRAYLSLLTCNMKTEHLDEITKKLWEFTQRFDNPHLVSALRKLNSPKTVVNNSEE